MRANQRPGPGVLFAKSRLIKYQLYRSKGCSGHPICLPLGGRTKRLNTSNCWTDGHQYNHAQPLVLNNETSGSIDTLAHYLSAHYARRLHGGGSLAHMWTHIDKDSPKTPPFFLFLSSPHALRREHLILLHKHPSLSSYGHHRLEPLHTPRSSERQASRHGVAYD